MIPTRIHGVIDYVVGVILILAPFLIGFADGGPAQWVLVTIGVLTVIFSLLTRYEFGAFRVLPMPIHLAIDIASGVLLLASPWVFGFADRIWWPHAVFGVAYIVIPLLTARRTSLDGAI